MSLRLHEELEVVRAAGDLGRVAERDQAFLVQIEERLIEGLHAVEVAFLDGVADQHGLVGVQDEVADPVRGHHDLDGGHAASAVGAREQALRDDALERAGKHDADLLLLVEREEVDDAVDGLGGVDGVQGAEHEVPRLGGGERRGDRLGVAHLADEDVVGVLAKHVLESRHVAVGVEADLTLVDDRLLVFVQDFDGVLDRDDVPAHGVVDVVDHRRQRGGLARTGGAGDEHQAARFQRDTLDDLRQVQFLEAGDLGGHLTHGDADAAALAEDVDAEAPERGGGVGEVDLIVLAEAADLLVGHDRRRHVFGVFGRERRLVHEGELAVHAQHRRTAGFDVQVGRVARHHLAEKIIDGFHVAAPLVAFSLRPVLRHDILRTLPRRRDSC